MSVNNYLQTGNQIIEKEKGDPKYMYIVLTETP